MSAPNITSHQPHATTAGGFLLTAADIQASSQRRTAMIRANLGLGAPAWDVPAAFGRLIAHGARP